MTLHSPGVPGADGGPESAQAQGAGAPGAATAGFRVGVLGLGVLVTAASWWIEDADAPVRLWRGLGLEWGHGALRDLSLLVFGLLLAFSSPTRSGLRIGRIRAHWRRVLVVCGLPVLATALVYPALAERPFAGAGPEMWIISPLGQDLVFAGFLYGWLEAAFPGRPHPHLPVTWALLIGAAFFAGWHLQNLAGSMSDGYVAFQLAYTAVGFVLVGLSRVWTGSILYQTLSHSAVNFVAWAAG